MIERGDAANTISYSRGVIDLKMIVFCPFIGFSLSKWNDDDGDGGGGDATTKRYVDKKWTQNQSITSDRV